MMLVKKYSIEILIITLVSALLFISSDPVMYKDSSRYLIGSSDGLPLYPLVIAIMQLIFKSLNSVVIFQTILIGISIIFFTKTVTKNFDLDFITKMLIAIFLFLPIIKFYNNLLTEPICNAFALFFISFIVKSIFNFSIRNIICSSIFMVLLLLTRNQFMFLYPVILLIYFGIFIIYSSKKTLILLVFSFLSIFVIHNSFIKLNKHFNKVSYENKSLSNNKTGIFHFIFIDSIYISSSEDIELFENQKLKETFTKIFKEIDNRKALVKYYDGRGHFGLSFAIIRDNATPKLMDLATQENTSVMALKKEISIKIISSNFQKYLKLIFKKFYDSTWLFVFVPFFMLLAALIEFFKHRSHFSLFILSLSIFALANHSVVYLFGRVQPRYLIYSDFILLIFIFIIFSIFLKKKEGRKKNL
jgi:hypothetical protein